MKTEYFFDGFFASLWKSGVRVIGTDDATHVLFGVVAEELRKDIWQEKQFPLLFPNPFTGRFSDFDDAILQWWKYRRIMFLDFHFKTAFLMLSHADVEHLLSVFTTDEQRVFLDCASQYSNALVHGV